MAVGFVIAHYYIYFLGLQALSWRSFAVTQAHPAADPAEQQLCERWMSIKELPQFPPVARSVEAAAAPVPLPAWGLCPDALKELKSLVGKAPASSYRGPGSTGAFQPPELRWINNRDGNRESRPICHRPGRLRGENKRGKRSGERKR